VTGFGGGCAMIGRRPPPPTPPAPPNTVRPALKLTANAATDTAVDACWQQQQNNDVISGKQARPLVDKYRDVIDKHNGKGSSVSNCVNTYRPMPLSAEQSDDVTGKMPNPMTTKSDDVTGKRELSSTAKIYDVTGKSAIPSVAKGNDVTVKDLLTGGNDADDVTGNKSATVSKNDTTTNELSISSQMSNNSTMMSDDDVIGKRNTNSCTSELTSSANKSGPESVTGVSTKKQQLLQKNGKDDDVIGKRSGRNRHGIMTSCGDQQERLHFL